MKFDWFSICMQSFCDICITCYAFMRRMYSYVSGCVVFAYLLRATVWVSCYLVVELCCKFNCVMLCTFYSNNMLTYLTELFHDRNEEGHLFFAVKGWRWRYSPNTGEVTGVTSTFSIYNGFRLPMNILWKFPTAVSLWAYDFWVTRSLWMTGVYRVTPKRQPLPNYQ